MLAVALALALVPPAPVITSGPEPGAQVTRSSATFEYRAGSGRTYGYECKVGRTATFEDCTRQPYTVTGLGVGTYTFFVRAYDVVDESVSPTVERTWTITAIDDDQDGSPVPNDCNDANPAAFPGATEVPGNGVDENCDGLDTVPATPAPVTPAAPAPTPTPSPAPVARPEIDFTLSYFMSARKRSTRFSALTLKRIPDGATITVTCTGGCPRKRVTITGKRGTVPLTAFRNRAIRTGAKLTIAVTKPGSTGMAKVVTIRSGKRPKIATRTLA